MGDPSPSTERQRRARSIFQAALSLPEIQRSTYVANVCRGELELRRDVERMLELDRQRTGELRRPLDHSAPPERVNNYDVVSKIGEGGMGAVFLARHHFFERNAALKVLHPHLCADETLVSRFLNEARAANAIRHVNIIEVIDAGLMPESGAPYLLMEHLTGENLGERLKRVGQMSLPEALQVVGQTASALAAAHDQGIVHRDLKPENLFLVPRIDGGDQVKVLDFGIAKLRPEMGGKFVKTQPGAVVGTPAYMSPEQCMGNAAIDHRTDIYALGVILFEMLSGRRPFEAEGMGGLLAAHLLNEPPSLSSFVPDVPTFVEEAVAKALRKKPDERFQTMRELRSAFGEAAVPRPLPQSAQMAAQTMSAGSGTHTSAPKYPTPPPPAPEAPAPAEQRAFRATMTSVDRMPMTVNREPQTTLNSTATELGGSEPRPRRRLVAVVSAATLGLAAALWLFARGDGGGAGAPASPPASTATTVPKAAVTAPVADPPIRENKPAVTAKTPRPATKPVETKTEPPSAEVPPGQGLAAPVTPPAKVTEVTGDEAPVPAEKPGAPDKLDKTVRPAPRPVAAPATPTKPGAPRPPRPRTDPAQPKEFEPPLW